MLQRDLRGPDWTIFEPRMMKQTEIPGRDSLEEIAMLALEFGRLVMEAGASARSVEEITTRVASGLGAERVDLRVGYASLANTIFNGGEGITRMRRVGPPSANYSLDNALHAAAARIEGRGMTASEAGAELDRLLQVSTRHPDWIVALAVGMACAAFGRLLGVDWAGVGPILAAATISQRVRRWLAVRRVNVFVATTLVAFLGSTLSGIGARWAGSQKVTVAMAAAVLLLVPGVPALNAQNDILEGHPTLGSARAVWVAMVLVFITAGMWLALGLLGEGP